MIEAMSGSGSAGSAQQAAPGPEMPPRGAVKREDVMLVVDDDPSIIETVTSILQDVGYRAVGVGSGAEALAFLRTTRPSLILLDMRMPEMDGWTVARRLHEQGSTIPLVVMTAAKSAERWADEIGASGYLAKPFTLDDLLDLVNRYRSDPSTN